MAGYAAGFSGLESFSPSLSIYLPRSIFPFTRAVLFSNARKSRKGNREREERSIIERSKGRNERKEEDGEKKREKQVVRGSSVQEMLDLVEISLISSVTSSGARTSAMKHQ